MIALSERGLVLRCLRCGRVVEGDRRCGCGSRQLEAPARW